MNREVPHQFVLSVMLSMTIVRKNPNFCFFFLSPLVIAGQGFPCIFFQEETKGQSSPLIVEFPHGHVRHGQILGAGEGRRRLSCRCSTKQATAHPACVHAASMCLLTRPPLPPLPPSPIPSETPTCLYLTCNLWNLHTTLRAIFGQHFVSRLSGAAFLIATQRNSCWLHFLLKDRSEKLKSARMSDHLTPTCKYLISVNHIAQPFILLLCSP